MKRWMKRLGWGTLVLFVLIQLVPYGWWHDNPPIVNAVVWPNAAAEEVARTSCYDCHSHETDWPIHSYVAPFSWLVRSDVERARSKMNFSDWNVEDAEDAIELILEGEMPPDRYTIIHRDARLTDEEKNVLRMAFAELMTADG